MASPPNGVYFPSLDECLKGNKLVLYVNNSAQRKRSAPWPTPEIKREEAER